MKVFDRVGIDAAVFADALDPVAYIDFRLLA
jgi:hypothetical protein